MSKQNRRRFDSKFKTKVVLEALKEQKTLSVLSKEYSLHAQQITDWKKQAIAQDYRLYLKAKRVQNRQKRRSYRTNLP